MEKQRDFFYLTPLSLAIIIMIAVGVNMGRIYHIQQHGVKKRAYVKHVFKNPYGKKSFTYDLGVKVYNEYEEEFYTLFNVPYELIVVGKTVFIYVYNKDAYLYEHYATIWSYWNVVGSVVMTLLLALARYAYVDN